MDGSISSIDVRNLSNKDSELGNKAWKHYSPKNHYWLGNIGYYFEIQLDINLNAEVTCDFRVYSCFQVHRDVSKLKFAIDVTESVYSLNGWKPKELMPMSLSR